MEKIVETKPCNQCGTSFDITDKDMEFYSKVSPIFAGKKYQIPAPTFCPDCRQQRRLAFRNERNLYRRKCDLTGKDIVSIYSPDKPYKAYDQEAWRSDKRDPMSFGQDFDFSKSFFQQFDELNKQVPHISLNTTANENSKYVNLSGYNKDCYLLFAGEYNEKCSYCERTMKSENCYDNTEISKCVHCYENVNIENCYQTFFSQNCKNCSNSYFLYDCNSCQDCFMCCNLQNKQYCILNNQYNKEEYLKEKKRITDLITNDIKAAKEKFETFKKTQIHRNLIQLNSENCIGDYMILSKNIQHGFDCTETEDSRYTYASFKGKNLMDITNTTEQEFAYEGMSVGYNSYNILFTYGGWTCKNLIYCIDCHHSEYLFACCGLRNKQYCIFNKQYTREEYEKLVPQIIEKMRAPSSAGKADPAKDGTGPERGEFFPPQIISPFGYNETVAMEYFPLSKDEAIKKGFKRSDYEAPFPKVEKTLQTNELPDIKEVTDEILDQAIICEVSGKPFKIIKPELEFYRKHNLPLPHRHPDQRHDDRMVLRNPRKLWDRKCDQCGIEIKSTYAPERKETVYCEACYNKEVY